MRQSDRSAGAVLLVSPWFRESVGGVAVVAERLLRLLTEAGIDTVIMVTDGTAASDHLERDPILPKIWYQEIPPFPFHSLRSIASALIRGSVVFWKIARTIKARQVQTILVLFPTECSWLFRILRFLKGTRLIVSCQGNDITKFHALPLHGRWAVRGVLKSADAIIVCADHLKEKVQKLVPAQRRPIVLIPNCIDVNYFTMPPLGFERLKSEQTIVHVSNFAPKKRTPDIIEAFAMADVPKNTRLVMVGAGHDLEVAMERAQSLRLGRRVEFVGTQRDVRPFLWQANLFVLASDDEGAPLVLLEAMACGLPWVSTAWGVAATLPNGECGLVVPPRSPGKLATAMAELINDPQRCKKMGLQARRRAETDFTVPIYLNAHLDLIQQMEYCN
jgi:glycosyltransferase involved in cell wall biosynthesis